jgi:hypothetical protein
MITGDLLQWKGNYPFSRIIRVGTGEEVNHTSMVIRLQEYPERVFSIEAKKDGLHLWPLSSLLREYDGFVNWYPLRRKYYGQIAEDSAKWMLAHLGVGYDFVGCGSNWRSILGFDPHLADAKYLYCSESVFLSFKERYVDPDSGITIGGGVAHLQEIKISPVPGKPMLALDLWSPHRSVQIVQEKMRQRYVKQPFPQFGSGEIPDSKMA